MRDTGVLGDCAAGTRKNHARCLQQLDSSRDFAGASPQIFAMRTHPWLLLAMFWIGGQSFASACIWDSDTLGDEKKARPAMAEAILGKTSDLGDPTKLRQRIAELNANRRENDPAWWNNLAGAYIRLGEPKLAVALLQTNVTRFPNVYGFHANL